MSEQLALLAEQLATSEADRRAHATRIHALEDELDQRDKALAQATQEVRETTEQLAKTRADLRAWKNETIALHERFADSEKENKATLNAMVKTLEQMLEGAAGKGPEPLPELPKLIVPPEGPAHSGKND